MARFFKAAGVSEHMLVPEVLSLRGYAELEHRYRVGSSTYFELCYVKEEPKTIEGLDPSGDPTHSFIPWSPEPPHPRPTDHASDL